MRTRLLVMAAVGLAIVGALVQKPTRLRHSELRPVLLRPALARTVTRPFLPLLVDLYWLRTLNAIGDVDSVEKNRTLAEYGRLLTDLDPRFYVAYTYVGLNIPLQTARNVWVNGDLASELFQKGLRQFPQDLKLHLYLGFCQYQMEKKYTDASATFASLSKIPGAPSFAATLATRLLAHQGNAEEGLELARQLMESTDDPVAREELELRVKQMQVEVQLERVDQAVEAFRKAYNRLPASMQELHDTGSYFGDDVDALGGRISIDEQGKAQSDWLGRRLTLYVQ